MTEPDRVLADLARDKGRDLVAYATLLTGDHAAAQDLVQDALVKVFGRMRTGFGPQTAEAYVRSAILTLYIDGFRRRRLWHGRVHLLVDHGPAGDPSATAGTRIDLSAALACLAPQERAAVVLRYYSDLTVPEVARQMGLAEGTVKRYLSNAMHKLEHRLGPVVAAGDSVPVLAAPDREA